MARAAAGERVNVEFVSANPTGPITVASGRHAAYGDSLCRILEFAGNEVEREYYVNDFGSQIERFAESIRARAKGEEPPEDGYQGEYVKELADRIDGAAEMPADELARRGVEIVLDQVRATLERFGVHMDRFSSERANHESGAVQAALDLLEEREHVYPLDGAVWLRTTAFGDDKDRVLMRSNGEFTYLAADIAYHADKLERGYDRAIDIWGADHHGHVVRMRAAWEILGGDPERLELLIMQLVNLLEGGQRAQMSKRAGTVVTLDELIDDIGVDATRWFLLQRSHDTTLDLDLELARTQSQDNPVFYAQYAHARIASILRKAGDERVRAALAADVAASPEELHPSARALVKRLIELPAEVAAAAERRAPAPDDHLHHRGGPGLLRVLPRLQGGRRGGGGRRRGPPDRDERAHAAGDRPRARPAWGTRTLRNVTSYPVLLMRPAILLALVLALALPGAAQASPRQISTMQDDGTFLGLTQHDPAAALREAKALGVDMVRAVIVWRRVAPAARADTPPADFDHGRSKRARLRLGDLRPVGGARAGGAG